MFKRLSWTITAPGLGSAAREAFGNLERVFALSGTPVARDSESVVLRVEIEGCGFYVKRYHTTKGLRSWLGFSRIRREAKNQLLFRKLGLPAAEVVAYGEEHFFTKTFRGVLVTRELEGTADLATTLKRSPGFFRDRRWVTRVCDQVADITRTLHRHRFCHNDLKWRNILVTQETETPQVFLIDCPVGQRWFGPLLAPRQVKDLACLDKVAREALSRTRRLHFFKRYRGCARLGDQDKRLLKKVLGYFDGED